MIQKRQKVMPKTPSVLVLSLVFLYFFIFIVNAQVVARDVQVIDVAERVRDYFVEATKGNIVGQQTGNKFGENSVLGTTEEDIQSQGGTLVFLQAAEIITISSDNAADTLLGTNATSVLIEGLDSNFLEISEVVNLLGTANVNTTNEYIRVNKMEVNEVGNYSFDNAGIITGTSAISGLVQIEIPAAEGTSKTTHFTVPAGQNLIITAFRITMDTGKEVDIFLKVRENADDIIPPVSPIKTLRDFRGLSTPIAGESKGNLKVGEKGDIWFRGVTSTGTSQVEVNYDFIQYAIGT